MNKALILLAGILLASQLTGCATPQPPLYHWGNYQQALYLHHQDGITQHAEQANALEALIARAAASGTSVPPGVHAHLGMLYSEMGRDQEARHQLQLERQLFPESDHFISYLLSAQQEPAQ